jgi:serine/threonine-protein kinase
MNPYDLFAGEMGYRPSGDPRPGMMLGEFQLGEMLGEGAHGIVFDAVRLVDGRRVALKVLKEKYLQDSQVYPRFWQEAQATARVKHPNIVEVLTIGYDQGVVYYPMEHLDGETLKAHLERNRAMPLEAVADLAVPLALALMAIHGAGFVHRDLKPANIFLCHAADGPFSPKILDFGIVKDLDPERMIAKTTTGTLLGTPVYMSPEQWNDSSQVTARSDQYSLGVILYECLSGQRPFSGKTREEVMYRVLNSSVTPLRQVVAGVPESVEQTVLAMIERDREKRFKTMRDVAKAFFPFASDTVKRDFASEFEETTPLLFGEPSIRASQFEHAMLAPGSPLAPIAPLDAVLAQWNSIPKDIPTLAPYEHHTDAKRQRVLWFLWGAVIAGAFAAFASVDRRDTRPLTASMHPLDVRPPRPPSPQPAPPPIEREPPPVVAYEPVDAGPHDASTVTAPPASALAPAPHAPPRTAPVTAPPSGISRPPRRSSPRSTFDNFGPRRR